MRSSSRLLLWRLVAGSGEEERSGEPVAAGLGDAVHLRATERVFGRAHRAQIDDDLLDGQRVGVVAAAGALEGADARRQRVVSHPVLQQARVERLAAVHGDAHRPLALAAADVLSVRGLDDRGNERGDAEHALRRRHRVEHFPANRALLRRALHVHQRRRARDRDGLLHLADAELDVHLGREVGAQLEAVALERGEAGERERHGVHARTQFGQPVLAAIVGDRRANLFNELRARGLHGDARQHGARGVADDAGDGGRAGALRQDRRRDQAQNDDEACATAESCQDHLFLLA